MTGSCACKSVLCLVFWCMIAINSMAQKNDTVYLFNGDRITGEIKRYEDGILVLSTTAMSTLNIEYDKISTLYSSKHFKMVTAKGFSYYGSIMSTQTGGSIGIVEPLDTIIKPIKEIVEFVPIRHKFWNKFYGSLDLGVSFYKSTKTLQYYLNTEVNYEARKDLITLDMNLLYSNQKFEDSLRITINNNIGLGYTHFFTGRWWGGTGVKYQANTELALAHRIQLSLEGGYDIVHSNPVRLYIMAGILANREKPTDSLPESSNMEGLLSTKFTWHKFSHPEINISSNFDFYPSLTIEGRLRLEYDLTAKYELFNDFYLSLTFYESYDSKPTAGGPALNDWNVVFSIGYTF